MSREGINIVGSRFSTILGAKNVLGDMEKLCRKAQYDGITRAEISFHLYGENHIDLLKKSIGFNWSEKVENLLNLISDEVLNHEEVISSTYRKLIINEMINKFSQVNKNLLMIGNSSWWIINLKTSFKNFFVGT